MIVFLTGASGVGKTSIVERLEKGYPEPGIKCFHFDSVGVPSREEMKSAEDWQQQTTQAWIDRLIAEDHSATVIIEGSTNIKFIHAGFEKHRFAEYLIILIDCEEETMMKRLRKNRNQPELANQDMRNWLQYLRNQAQDLSIDVIDTTHLTPDGSIDLLLEKIEFANKRSIS